MNRKENTDRTERETCLRELRECLCEHLKRYPLANEEDMVKFVFQGMLGAGHLVSSQTAAVRELKNEMQSLEADGSEPMFEDLGCCWCRINLRAALSKGLWAEQIAMIMCRSAEKDPKMFSRQDVYDFCMDFAEKDPEGMRKAAEKVTDGRWLPSHSDAYREAYNPSYRVVLKECVTNVHLL